MKSGIGEFLSILRKSKGLTQQEVADALGVSNKTVSSWETGASCPDISILPVLAELYDVTCDEIVRGKRISVAETEKNIDAKRDKAINRMLQKQRINLITICWISGGLTALGIILTLVMIAVLCACFLFLPERFILLKLALAMIVSGAVGNLVDRIAFGYVRDFVWVNMFFNQACCNFADFWIVFGVIIAVIDSLFLNEWAILPLTARAKAAQAAAKERSESQGNEDGASSDSDGKKSDGEKSDDSDEKEDK